MSALTLIETLSSTNAIWVLASIMLPKAPDADLRKDSNPLIEALFNYQLLHVEAYIVYVDMALQNEVAFKLTPVSWCLCGRLAPPACPRVV
jgi:hypothetical protein